MNNKGANDWSAEEKMEKEHGKMIWPDQDLIENNKK